MIIVILFIVGIVFSFLTYCVYDTFKDSNWDIIRCIKSDQKGFFKVVLGIIVCLVITYWCIVTPSYAISNQYYHKNGTITSVEYSISGDSVIKNNIRAPKDTYGKVLKVHYYSRYYCKMTHYYTDFTIKLNDGRIMTETWNGTYHEIKEGNGMSITETFYPSYKVDYNFN